jgi:DNA-binding transcriptional regulator YiaG
MQHISTCRIKTLTCNAARARVCCKFLLRAGELSCVKSQSKLLDEVRTSRRMPSPETARMIRRAAHVSQTRMACELGVDRITLYRWESGLAQPRSAARAKWAALLDELQRELAA